MVVWRWDMKEKNISHELHWVFASFYCGLIFNEDEGRLAIFACSIRPTCVHLVGCGTLVYSWWFGDVFDFGMVNYGWEGVYDKLSLSVAAKQIVGIILSFDGIVVFVVF